jgi:Zn-dependent protease with chaperone function
MRYPEFARLDRLHNSGPALAQWSDLALAHIPVNALTVAWLLVALLSFAAIGTISPVTGLLLGLFTLVRTAMIRHTAAGTLAKFREVAPPMRRNWQPRYFLIRRLVRRFAVAQGIEAPEIIIDGANIIGRLNAAALHLEGRQTIIIDWRLFEHNASKMFGDSTLAGIIAHEIAHLRPSQLERETLANWRRAYSGSLLPALVSGCLFAAAPISLFLLMWPALGAITYLALLARRREEIEADLRGADFFARGGRSAILDALLLVGVATATSQVADCPSERLVARFRRAIERAGRFGALAIGPDFSSACQTMVSVEEQYGFADRLSGLVYRVKHPFPDHPNVEAVARRLGLSQIDNDIALEPAGKAFPGGRFVLRVTIKQS